MHPVECVAFMLTQGNHVLAEKRKRTKQLTPGVGHHNKLENERIDKFRNEKVKIVMSDPVNDRPR
jgi:hypothetical protein